MQQAAALVFLAAVSRIDYVWPGLDPYTNFSYFEVVGQGYTGSPPTWISLTHRHRGGSSLDGGYQHREVKFSVPIHARSSQRTRVDEVFLIALDHAAQDEAGSSLFERLATALPFFAVANTDSRLISDLAEAILLASAFEQLFNARGDKQRLVDRFTRAFGPFAAVQVKNAIATRPGIAFIDPESRATQLAWPIHAKWMEELYDVRSKAVHHGSVARRSWGWTIGEHLLIGSWVFPRVVKCRLADENRYVMTERDIADCESLDTLLAADTWGEDSDGRNAWGRILSHHRAQRAWKTIAQKIDRELTGQPTPETDSD